MTARSLRDAVEAIYRAAIERVEAGAAVRRALSRSDEGRWRVGDREYASSDQGVWAIAIGKAACPMMAAVEEIGAGDLKAGLVITKEAPGGIHLRSTVLVGSHPVPDERSLAAGQALIDFVAGIPQGAFVLCLISGGGSALVEALRPGVTLDDLREVTGSLLRARASIAELNAVRSRLSELKGGGLLRMLHGRTVVNLIVSDVLGSPLPMIASGPTVLPDRSSQASDVVRRYGLDVRLPIEREHDIDPPAQTMIIADVSTAVAAAADEAASMGLRTHVLTDSIDIEAREAGRLFASVVVDTRRGHSTFAPPCCLLAGGETVVTVRGDGTGGRNCEAAVAAAIRVAGADRCAIGCLATDGDDGVSGAAGGIVDGATLDDRRAAVDALDDNDTYTWLAARGAALVTGPSGTNVNDLFVGIVVPAGWTGR